MVPDCWAGYAMVGGGIDICWGYDGAGADCGDTYFSPSFGGGGR